MRAPMDPRSRIAVALVLAVIGTVAGCGDDGPREVSAEELVAEGDALCREGQQRFAEIQSEPLRNANDAAEQTGALIEAAEDELNDLRDLVPPDELADSYNAWLEARVRAIEVFKQGQDAAEQDDDQGYVAAQTRANAGAAKRQELATAIGFQVCSKAATGR
jgi:predicted small lipoprotein YifL